MKNETKNWKRTTIPFWDREPAIVGIFKGRKKSTPFTTMATTVFAVFMGSGLFVVPLLIGLHADGVIVLSKASLQMGIVMMSMSAGLLICLFLPLRGMRALVEIVTGRSR